MFQKHEKELETSLASKKRVDARLHMHSNKNLPLHSKCSPLIGLMATCDDEPVKTVLTEQNTDTIDEREREHQNNKRDVDNIEFGTSSTNAPFYKRIKIDNIYILQSERAEEEPEMVRDARELTRISKAVVAQNHMDTVERKKRQQIMENDVGIRELAFQLNKARATVSLERQAREFRENKEKQALDARKERNEILERIEREKREENTMKKSKNRAYREALLEQIESRRIDRVKNNAAMMEEDRIRREMNSKLLIETEARERALNAERKRLFKRDIDNCIEIRERIRATAEAEAAAAAATTDASSVLDIGLLDSCRGPTAMARQFVEEHRKKMRMERAKSTDGVVEQLQTLKEEQLKRDDIIYDLLVRERVAREEKEDKHINETRYEKRKQINDALAEQRMQDFARRTLEKFNEKFFTLPTDIRSFRQRQCLAEQERCERAKREKLELRRFLQAEIQEKIELKKEAVRENLTNTRKLDETLKEQDKLVKAERHLMLLNEPIDTLAKLRNGVLSEEEMQLYGVPKRTAVAWERKPERSVMCTSKIN